MLGLLTGKVVAYSRGRVLVVVHGGVTSAVGYWVHTGSWQPSGEVTCFLYHQVREDSNQLFGFATLSELELFEKLISVSGVGPKAGLAILSLGSPERIVQAILHDDTALLSLAPGIGKKAAEKVVVELRNKLSDFAKDSGSARIENQLMDALTALGYKPVEVSAIAASMPSSVEGLDAQIRYILKKLSQ